MPSVDVLIVGAGPGGSAAAVHARAAGLSVRVVEKARFPRDKTCGDGLTTLALRELALLGVTPTSVGGWRQISSVKVTTPVDRVVELPLPDDGSTYVAIAPRTELDGHLLELALAAGADIREGTAVTNLARVGDKWVAQCDDGSVQEASHALHCAGARGLPFLRTSEGRSRQGHADEVAASRVYLQGQRRLAGRVHLWFWDRVLPGYAWAFPVGENWVNVGVLLHRAGRSPSDLVTATRLLLQSEWLAGLVGDSARQTGSIRVWPIPSRMSRDPSAGGLLRVGDAAGLADPMTGEGIAQSLVSARLAIGSITRDFDRPDRAAAAYAREVRRTFSADQRTSRLLVRALNRPGLADAAVRFMGKTDDLATWFARWTFEDVPRRAVLSPVSIIQNRRGGLGIDLEEASVKHGKSRRSEPG